MTRMKKSVRKLYRRESVLIALTRQDVARMSTMKHQRLPLKATMKRDPAIVKKKTKRSKRSATFFPKIRILGMSLDPLADRTARLLWTSKPKDQCRDPCK